MDRKKAIEWMAREIRYLKLAPKVNGCEMTEEWAEQIQIYELAIDALSREEAAEKNVERTTKCSGIRCVMQSGTVDPGNCPVENCPNFTPEKKHGHWIPMDSDGIDQIYKCSACGRIVLTHAYATSMISEYPYCHCGAKMDLGDNNTHEEAVAALKERENNGL